MVLAHGTYNYLTVDEAILLFTHPTIFLNVLNLIPTIIQTHGADSDAQIMS